MAGYKKYTPLPDLTGTGKGDPEAAKKMLEAAGKVGFELSWYYDNTLPIPQQVSQIPVLPAVGPASVRVRGHRPNLVPRAQRSVAVVARHWWLAIRV